MNRSFYPLIILVLFICCDGGDDPADELELDFKQEMRNFVIGLSDNAKSSRSDFFIIPQNGIELVTSNGEDDGSPDISYLNAIDGHGQEDLFFGYNSDNQATPSEDNSYLRAFLDISENHGNQILVTDYCSTISNMDDSYDKNSSANYISFASDNRELNNIPNHPNPIFNENDAIITQLSEVSNFLYLINPNRFSSKQNFINAVVSTNYDLLIMDLFFNEVAFTSSEIDQLKIKANGGSRLVICYMSIGEAEDYRYYWQSDWNSDKPSWLDAENPDWAGNFKVKYWEQEWQNIIYGNDDSYLNRMVEANFDGVYLDIIDAFEFYE